MKKALWAGGIQRANKPPDKSSTPGMAGWQDMVRQCSLHPPVVCDDDEVRRHEFLTAAYLYMLKEPHHA